MSNNRMPMRGYWIWLGVLVAITALPILLAMGVDWFMQANGCASNWKMGSTCLIGGDDWGLRLNSTIAWSMIVGALGFYVTAGGIVIWAVLLVGHILRWRAASR